MKRFILYSVQGKMITILILFMTLSLAASWFTIRQISENIIIGDKQQKLMSYAEFLDVNLGDRSYDDILAELGASDASVKDKIAALNSVLKDSTDALVAGHPEMGVGYYSRALDAIITYGPSSEYQQTVGNAIGKDHPGRNVMAENQPAIHSGTMVRGNILNAMHPISRNGEVIGYAWANELTTDIEAQFNETTGRMLAIMGVIYVLAIGIAVVLSRRTMRDINKIVKGVRQLRYDLTLTLEKTDGELGEVVDSINTMAADIAKANQEHESLLMAEAANLAQRDFLARMSHEIRTPMNGVLGMTMLAKNAATEELRLRYLDKIHASASILLGIINDILDVSKIEAGKMEIERHPFNIRKTVEGISDLISPRTDEKGLRFDIFVDKTVPDMAVGDGLRLSQVLLNILGNAVKFTGDGSITLSIKAETLPSDMLSLTCSVRDTGIGMDAQRQEDVFKPFTQADSSTARKFGGTGLGLSISKALVELMGGEITLSSEIGVGSEFSFSIVMEPYAGETIEETEAAVNADRRYDGHTVLVVEDNEINREIINVVLTEMGLSLEFAENGEKGVEAFTKKDYDLIFMDIRMPIMDGLEATQIIRRIERERSDAGEGQSAPRVPIIAMTANAMQEDREASAAAGMDGHVAKPIRLEEIQVVLTKYLTA